MKKLKKSNAKLPDNLHPPNPIVVQSPPLPPLKIQNMYGRRIDGTQSTGPGNTGGEMHDRFCDYNRATDF